MPADNLSAKKKRQWQHVYDSAKAKGADEASAHKQANAVVGRSKKDFDEDTLRLLESKGYIDEPWDVEGKRLPQDEAGYQPLAGTAEKACLNCHWFIPQDDACVIVAGDIYHTGISDYWMAQEVYTPDPIPVAIVGDSAPASTKSAGILQASFDRIKSAFKPSDKPPASPVVQPKTDQPILFFKSDDGRYRYFTRYSNAFKDREREFISTISQKEYVEWCNNTGFRPELWLWHTKGSRLGIADIVGFTDGIAWASGWIDDNPFAVKTVEKLSDGTSELGASHGYIPLIQVGPVVLQHRTIETTVLPRAKAANWWTDYNFLKVKELGLKPEQVKWFKEQGVPDDVITQWSGTTEQLGKALIDAGLEYKEVSEDDGTNTLGMILVTQANSAKAMTQLTEQYKELSETVKAMKASDDEKIAQTIAPQNQPNPNVHVASQSDDNIIAKDMKQKEADGAGEYGFLEQALGLKPGSLTGVPQ